MNRDALEQIHGVYPRGGGPNYSAWFRQHAATAWAAFARESRLPRTLLAQYTGLAVYTVRTLERRKSLPWRRTITRLITLGIIDPHTAEPNLEKARALRPLADALRRERHGKFAHWGIGEALRTWRKARALTQHELARQLDVPPYSLAHWETGAVIPAPKTLVMLVHRGIVERHVARALLDSDHFEKVPHLRGTTRAILGTDAPRD